MKRCKWCENDDLYMSYHDNDWGQPVLDDRTMFEFLLLETFQAGLSWITILRKRENFRRAFDDFNYEIVAGYDENKVQDLLADAGIIRNQLKIRAAINNARLVPEIQKEFGSLCDYFWQWVDYKPVVKEPKSVAEYCANDALSDAISKDMKKRGFKFVGTTVVYAHLQACGLVYEHEADCFLAGKAPKRVEIKEAF